jgi:uncharacterized integral membrane protein
MLRKIVRTLVLVPLAILIVVLAVANRHGVTISLDPFSPTAPALSLTVPLFLVILLAVIGGVILGGTAAWFRQAKWRRTARHLLGRLRTNEAELDAMRRQAQSEAGAPSGNNVVSIRSVAYRRPPAA